MLIILLSIACEDAWDCGQAVGTKTVTITKSGDSESEVLSDLNNYFNRISSLGANEGYNITYTIISVEQVSERKYSITYQVEQTKL